MANPIRLEVNCETGEVTEIELSDAEVAEMQAQSEAYAAEQAKRDAEQAAADAKKQAVLSALAKAAGLTVDEVQAALS